MIVEYVLPYDSYSSSSSPLSSVVNIREEKFIDANDVVSTTITADRPISLELSGRSFAPLANGKLIGGLDVTGLQGQCEFDADQNAIHVVEHGTAKAHEQQVKDEAGKKTDYFVDGRLMYDGMSSVLSASRAMTDVSHHTVNVQDYLPDPRKRGNLTGSWCNYTFRVAVDSAGTTVSWAMRDDYETALTNVKALLANPAAALEAKTHEMNRQLNEVVPYFNCSDQGVVKVYYYLWSIYLMYITQGDAGTLQQYPHTQTALNNFLGCNL